jgi:hypothetical protein
MKRYMKWQTAFDGFRGDNHSGSSQPSVTAEVPSSAHNIETFFWCHHSVASSLRDKSGWVLTRSPSLSLGTWDRQNWLTRNTQWSARVAWHSFGRSWPAFPAIGWSVNSAALKLFNPIAFWGPIGEARWRAKLWLLTRTISNYFLRVNLSLATGVTNYQCR